MERIMFSPLSTTEGCNLLFITFPGKHDALLCLPDSRLNGSQKSVMIPIYPFKCVVKQVLTGTHVETIVYRRNLKIPI